MGEEHLLPKGSTTCRRDNLRRHSFETAEARAVLRIERERHERRPALDDRQALFALGWLAHERDDAISRCVAALRGLRKAPVFW